MLGVTTRLLWWLLVSNLDYDNYQEAFNIGRIHQVVLGSRFRPLSDTTGQVLAKSTNFYIYEASLGRQEVADTSAVRLFA